MFSHEPVTDIGGILNGKTVIALHSLPSNITKPKLSQHPTRGYWRLRYKDATGRKCELHIGELDSGQQCLIDEWLDDFWPDVSCAGMRLRIDELRENRKRLRDEAVMLADQCGCSFRGYTLVGTAEGPIWIPATEDLTQVLMRIQAIHWQMVGVLVVAIETVGSLRYKNRLLAMGRAVDSAMTKTTASVQRLLNVRDQAA